MKTLVIGATGYVGSHIVRRMVRDGPFSPDEWAGLVPALRTLSGDPEGAAPLS